MQQGRRNRAAASAHVKHNRDCLLPARLAELQWYNGTQLKVWGTKWITAGMGRNIQNDSILSALEVETKEGTYDSLMGKIKKILYASLKCSYLFSVILHK